MMHVKVINVAGRLHIGITDQLLFVFDDKGRNIAHARAPFCHVDFVWRPRMQLRAGIQRCIDMPDRIVEQMPQCDLLARPESPDLHDGDPWYEPTTWDCT